MLFRCNDDPNCSGLPPVSLSPIHVTMIYHYHKHLASQAGIEPAQSVPKTDDLPLIYREIYSSPSWN